MKKNELKNQVEEILKDYPQGRDSDVWLTLKIWTKYHPSKIHEIEKDTAEVRSYVFLYDIMSLPREDNVKRIRAHFQNDLGKYLPTTWEVAKKRRIEEKVWREFARTSNFK